MRTESELLSHPDPSHGGEADANLRVYSALNDQGQGLATVEIELRIAGAMQRLQREKDNIYSRAWPPP